MISLTAAALMCSILLMLVPSGKTAGLLRLVCGLFLTAVLLAPITRISFPELTDYLNLEISAGEDAARQGAEMAQSERLGCIQAALEAYILDKASAEGCSLSVRIRLDGEGMPLSAWIRGSVTPQQRQKLKAIITNDLGIPEEDQQWTGETGRNS